MSMRRPAAHGEEYIFLENATGTVERQRLAPSVEMGGHRVNERAVAIKNHRFKTRGGNEKGPMLAMSPQGLGTALRLGKTRD